MAVHRHRFRQVRAFDDNGQSRQAITRRQLPEQPGDHLRSPRAAGALPPRHPRRQNTLDGGAELARPAQVGRLDAVGDHLLQPHGEGLETAPRT